MLFKHKQLASAMDMYFNTKREALASLPYNKILANRNLREYFHVENHSSLLHKIKENPIPHVYEYIPKLQPVNLFFDIEIRKHKYPIEYDSSEQVINNVKLAVDQRFPEHTNQFIVLESHTALKKSYHVIVHIRPTKQSCLLF